MSIAELQLSIGDASRMGEIRADVSLSNVADELRAISGEIRPADVRRCEIDAVVDTGAVSSVLPLRIARLLGVVLEETRVAEYADGRQERVNLAAPIRFSIMGRDTIDEALILGDEVLIGQTVLEKLDLLADCARRRVVANPEHPDQPVLKIRSLG
jgi:clan AA aspartic protease